ncbi:hypothetical protein F5148DRAFT_587166 [Russula earlei]|uniref:Uncharacterized protein n=1 Tax=Russula earlei TaxID=71964 RepID=A0ACC0TV98_9AGAM|nr:hypothetical protein F5148DRAFT_587166 [Russula earlei]
MTAMTSEGVMTPPPLTIGVLLVAILLNMCLFGVVSQQFYSYWTSGFEDSTRVKLFVVTQISIISLQSLILWQMAWLSLVEHYGMLLDPNAYTWRLSVSSMCECVLVLSANIFLSIRIRSLTGSRLQSGLTMTFSSCAFVLGMATTAITWFQTSQRSFAVTQKITSEATALAVAWHGLQALSECLITALLARALLKSRSGLRKSDTVVKYLVRTVIQIGLVAAVWAVGELVTWFFLPKQAIYTILSSTSGSFYTHLR